MNFPAKTIFAAVLAVTGLAATVETSSAMTLAPAASGASSLVQDVRWGCGPGWHPNPWGRCVPDRRRPVYYYGGYGGYRDGGYDGYRGGYGEYRGGYREHHRDHYWGRPIYRPEHRWDRY